MERKKFPAALFILFCSIYFRPIYIDVVLNFFI